TRLRVSFGSLLLLILLVISRARGSYVAFLVGAAALVGLAMWRRSFVHVMAALVLGAVVASGVLLLLGGNASHSEYARFLRLDKEGMLDQRVDIWKANGTFWTEHPIFGVGLGNEANLSELSKRSHSAYLSILNEGGAPALILLVLSLIYVVRRAAMLALK